MVIDIKIKIHQVKNLMYLVIIQVQNHQMKKNIKIKRNQEDFENRIRKRNNVIIHNNIIYLKSYCNCLENLE